MNLVKLADYHMWANNRVRNKLLELGEEEYAREVIPPYKSIKNLVIHSIIAVEYNLRLRVDGEEAHPEEIGEKIASMSIAEAMMHWEKIDKQLVEFATTHLDLEAVFPNFLREGEITVDHDDFFTQYLIHTAYHRSQIMSALRMMEKEGIGTDYLFYLSHLAIDR